MVLASPTSSSTDIGVPISERMTGMKKSVGESVLRSISSAPIVQATMEVAELTSNVQILDRNTGSKMAIFGRLPPLSEICSEPKTEEAPRALMINDSTQSAYLQDRIQEAAVASEVPPEDIAIPSTGPAKAQSQPVANPPCFEKETRCPEISVSNPTEVQDRARPDWMNTPVSSSHPSPGGHPDHPSIFTSRMSLNEIALNDKKLNEIMRIGIHQQRLWIGHLQQEVRSLSQNRVDPITLEEMKNKMEAAIAKPSQYKDQNLNPESELQKARDELQSSKLRLSDFQNELTYLSSKLLIRLRPESLESSLDNVHLVAYASFRDSADMLA
ncbi:hypothetical protein Nepgr_032643 [Nepenthes gracilis]|uniref:Uncharacterized protein n=1 Tax=Nepenthes gracilis TaxID=150966 RepID=A0AAD3TJ07_NEPGR|nr:hypothetical protein Nepgr_032643 [Nepenthes gracilis]